MFLKANGPQVVLEALAMENIVSTTLPSLAFDLLEDNVDFGRSILYQKFLK